MNEPISKSKTPLPPNPQEGSPRPGDASDKAPSAFDMIEAATAAIEAKTAVLGGVFTGPSLSLVIPCVPSSSDPNFQQSFANCVIYWSPTTGAHELHGDILAKYSERDWGIGLPVTDETGAPDGVGRYNHFENGGSIYYLPSIGPKVVLGAVRDYWASQSWERGPLGYPVRDCFVPQPGQLAGDFQNGVIWIGSIDGQAPAGYADAAVAPISSDQLQDIIWHQFDDQVHKSPDNIGLHPEKSLDGVADYGYGFDQAVNRGVMMTINGFHDNGALLPDTNFVARITVDLVISNDLTRGPNDDYAVGAKLVNRGVDASGIAASKVASGVSDKIDALATLGVSTVSADAPLLSIKTMSDGSANLYFAPTLAGRLAILKATSEIADLAAGVE